MLRLLACFAPWTLLLLLVGTAAAQETAGAPRMVIENPTFDFGSVEEGVPVEAVFRITNSGSGPLEIKRIQPSCGCTATSSSSSTVGEGETTEIHATFDTAGFQGLKVKTIRLYTNDPKQPTAVLTLRGTVREEILVDPPRVYFGDVPKGKEQTRVVSLLTNEGSNIRIEDISSRSDQLVLQAEDSARDGKLGKRVLVTLRDTVGAGVFRSTLVARTTSTKRPLVTVPVFARVEGDLKIVPSYVSFDLLQGPLARPVTQRVELQNYGPQPIRLESIESDNPAVLVQAREVKPGQLFEITVALAAGAVGTIRSKVNVVTNYPVAAEKTVSFRVYGIIARQGE